MTKETSYGFRKRLDFVMEVMNSASARRVLEVGCGTGALLAVPLAAAFPETTIVGADPDLASIEFARAQPHPENLSFSTEVASTDTFDLVIASEVLEHVADPESFLADLRTRMTDTGRLVVTTPNGYGPFELACLVASIARGIQHRRGGERERTPHRAATFADTLADSPHVNFFSRRALELHFARSGWRPTRFRARTLLCGPGLDHLVRGRTLLRLNGWAADRLPWVASDWMYELVQVDPIASVRPPSPSRYANIRRAVDEWAASS